jgi:DNA-3-methyladenine glycosylase II
VTSRFTIRPRGPFSLEEAATFGFGQRIDPTWDGIMRLAFCVDGYRDQVGVEIRQDDLGVHCILHGEADPAVVERQVARVLSLDFDGEAFIEIGRRDPIIGQLQAAAPGLRPPLFYSPYEAAAWSIISARRPARQMAEVRRNLGEAHGRVFELAGQRVAALPTPEQLLRVVSFAGLTPEKVERLHGVGRAAIAGMLDVARIQAMGPEAAMEDLRSLKGIGPFYSSLIVVRGSGFADVAVMEPKAMEFAAKLYGLPRPPSEEEFRAMAHRWRPFRTWAIVLMRAAGSRILAGQ